MVLSNIKISDVSDRGVPNRERIILEVIQNCSASYFYLGLGLSRGPNLIEPINDNLFWLGNGYFFSGDRIIVYTGSGHPNSHEIPNQDARIFSFFWGRKKVLFGSREIVPFLFQMADLQIGPSQIDHSAIVNAMLGIDPQST